MTCVWVDCNGQSRWVLYAAFLVCRVPPKVVKMLRLLLMWVLADAPAALVLVVSVYPFACVVVSVMRICN